MSIDARRLVVLRAVDRYGGVVGAAAALRVSPSAVSQQLLALERECGLSLIDRSRRGGQRPLEFTTAGRRLVQHADRLVDVLEEAEAELGALADTVAGPVAIAAFLTVLRGFAGSALVELGLTHPGLQPRVVQQVDEAAVIRDLQAGRLDVVLVEDDAQGRRTVPRGLHYEALADDPFRVVVPVDWPEVDELASVADRPWIGGPPDSALGHALLRLGRTSGLRLNVAHQCQDFTAALAMVSVGLAGAFVPELALAASAPPDVRVVQLPGLGARRIGVLYRRSRREPTQAVLTVLEALRAAASAGAPA